ncbi:helix-turn-helix domain-containing protein [Paenibacillus elgii]|uniref:helix-turn-helix domain-containing protein n=1 Tax=Paenibacillus elgii TaxID=189691 RepID=UPI0020421878|nr:helix-turn-helix transcriptional regulator [Paenibacillus elgii]MCM3274362.1 helix-turn-helix transcriptional regulator [Paenibacillus elgii]
MKVIIHLEEKLEEIGISRRELSRLTSIRHPTINEMCNNEIEYLPLKNLAKICKVLNCQISDLLSLEENEDEN